MSIALTVLMVLGVSPAGSLDGLKCDSTLVASQQIEAAMQTGTLLVTEGDCLAVRVYTQSPFTHVATVVVRNGRPVVYDAANGVGVRCLSLEKYLGTQGRNEIHVFQPKEPLTDEAQKKLESYLDSQLGRPYEVQHFVRGERGRGVHCSEYVTDALMHTGLLKAQQPARVSPASLVQGITRDAIYAQKQTVFIQPPEAVRSNATTWYGQLWDETKSCTTDCCQQTKSWLFCK